MTVVSVFYILFCFFFFFKQKTAYEMRISDWSSDVCSSDLGFAVAKRFPKAVEAGSFGQMTGWSVSDAFADTPVIAAEGGFTGQGYTCGYTILTPLAADKPVDLARVQTLYDDTGAQGEAGQSIRRSITQIDRGRGFTVPYNGTG